MARDSKCKSHPHIDKMKSQQDRGRRMEDWATVPDFVPRVDLSSLSVRRDKT